jgi:NhaA family Na+:H+ antiporter
MALPALLFTAVNAGGAAARGWGVPMATDIAFAVGVLALLAGRVRPALRVLLLTLAVIDDLGAIVIIALFYSAQVSLAGFLVAGGGLGLIVLLRWLGVRAVIAYVPAALVVWAGAVLAGVHPTMAGVAVGLMTPVRADGGASPAERLERALHRWVAFVIMPLFALANAGVPLGGASFDGAGVRAFLGVLAGLTIGKPLGVVAFSWAATKLGWAERPAGARWSEVLVVGFGAGIGFTMALFIAALAFPEGPLLETVKLAILCGSTLSALAGLIAGRLLPPRPPVP